ncbi:hypothetical protein NHQ30_011343 [Ciborinia camelliae]|nr:hypothetical protein NHQ30_011343 [Ciborinia camelliae]
MFGPGTHVDSKAGQNRNSRFCQLNNKLLTPPSSSGSVGSTIPFYHAGEASQHIRKVMGQHYRAV